MLRARHDDELRHFLSWRRKTRFLRHHGGPLLALVLVLVCILLLFRLSRYPDLPPAREDQKAIDALLSQKKGLH